MQWMPLAIVSSEESIWVNHLFEAEKIVSKEVKRKSEEEEEKRLKVKEEGV